MFQLGCNKVGDEGAGHIARALAASKGSSGLQWLALGGNGISDEGAVKLARALEGKGGE